MLVFGERYLFAVLPSTRGTTMDDGLTARSHSNHPGTTTRLPSQRNGSSAVRPRLPDQWIRTSHIEAQVKGMTEFWFLTARQSSRMWRTTI
jgi:hypothetical protein